MTKISTDLRALLDSEAERINSAAFIADDPVQFPRRFSDQRDVEIMALLSAVIAWGRRAMICRDAERLIDIMRSEPYAYLMSGDYETLDPARNLHRTFFARHFIQMMRGLRRIYSAYPTLDAFAASRRVGSDEAPAWAFAKALGEEIMEANGGEPCSQCVPVNLKFTALKRINMMLRWLVRDDGIVDMGLWKSISKAQLYVPLDVHVGNTARALGLLTRRGNDRKAVEELTGVLRTLRPDDPCLYDYALFGLGVEGRLAQVGEKK